MKEIEEIVNRETKAWDTQDVDLLLSIFHKDMVWPWPRNSKDHDPATWELDLGKFDFVRWKEIYSRFFKEHELIHNNRSIVSIKVSNENDGAFAVVDIDTLWKNRKTKEENHWLGRVCKVFTKLEDDWKLIMHTGALEY